MKISQLTEHVWSVRMWMIIPVQVWLVAEEEGVTLIDAGIPSMAKGIMRCLERMNAGPLRRILLTHGHSDHVGAVPTLLKHTQVPVQVHRIELPYMEGDAPYPGRKKAGVSLARGMASPLYEDVEGKLISIGGLTPYHTPGHSPGHVAYYHEEDQILLAGDLFTSKRGQLKRPMPIFTADMKEAIRSGEIVRQLQPKQLEVCHGYTVMHPASQWEDYRRKYQVN